MRRVSRYSIALIGLVVASMLGVTAVQAASGEESSFASKINGERSSRGIATLRWNEDLAQVARRHSRRMADQDNLHHNPNLRNEVDGWEVLGENVGYGPSVDDLHQAFMNSPGHRANIVDDEYTHVGVGTVWDDGTLWVTEVFMRPSGSRASSGGGSGSGSSTPARRPKRRAAPKPPAKQPAVPPRRSAPLPAPVAQATPPAADLTRLMVEKVLESHEPAVGSIYAAELLMVPVSAGGDDSLVRLSFLPFANLAGRVSRSLIEGTRPS